MIFHRVYNKIHWHTCVPVENILFLSHCVLNISHCSFVSVSDFWHTLYRWTECGVASVGHRRTVHWWSHAWQIHLRQPRKWISYSLDIPLSQQQVVWSLPYAMQQNSNLLHSLWVWNSIMCWVGCETPLKLNSADVMVVDRPLQVCTGVHFFCKLYIIS